MAEVFMKRGLGWRPDLPSFQDYDESTRTIPVRLLNHAGVRSLGELTNELDVDPGSLKKLTYSSEPDLRDGCSPVKNQETIGSCTAHAVMAVGFDDSMAIRNNHCSEAESKGDLVILNSRGEDRGDSGCGCLPYDYVLVGLAIDWWPQLKAEWMDIKQFGI